MSEEDLESPYCEVCGTCGYIGCCGIRNFIDKHIKGKTNCKNEDLIISELIDLVEYEEEKDKEIEKLTKKLDKEKSKNKKALKLVDEAMTNTMITGEATLNLIELYTILKGRDKK